MNIRDSLLDECPSWTTPRQWTIQQPFLDWLAIAGRQSPADAYFNISASRVTIVGAGGSGSLTALLLVAAGVRKVRIIDGDVVELSNLGRQLPYNARDVGTAKVDALARALLERDPEVAVESHNEYVSGRATARRLLAGSSIVLVTADEPIPELYQWVDSACKLNGAAYLPTCYSTFGPMFVPGRSPCYYCATRQMEDKAVLYNDFALAQGRERRGRRSVPANPAAIAAAAGVYCDEILRFISRLARPRSYGSQVRVDGDTLVSEKVTCSDYCQWCRRDELG